MCVRLCGSVIIRNCCERTKAALKSNKTYSSQFIQYLLPLLWFYSFHQSVLEKTGLLSTNFVQHLPYSRHLYFSLVPFHNSQQNNIKLSISYSATNTALYTTMVIFTFIVGHLRSLNVIVLSRVVTMLRMVTLLWNGIRSCENNHYSVVRDLYSRQCSCENILHLRNRYNTSKT
jgi:hypothetical protein